MSSMVIFTFDLVNALNPSAQVATNWIGIPGVILRWKYSFASLIRLSFGIGYFNVNQLEECTRQQTNTNEKPSSATH